MEGSAAEFKIGKATTFGKLVERMADAPDGKALYALLISLYAEQEGVSITYELEANDGI